MTSCQKIMTSTSFFQFLSEIDESGSRIPEAWSVILTFLLISTFHQYQNQYHKNDKQNLKMLIFAINLLTSVKLRGSIMLRGSIKLCVYWRTKFQDSIIILTSSAKLGREGEGGSIIIPYLWVKVLFLPKILIFYEKYWHQLN